MLHTKQYMPLILMILLKNYKNLIKNLRILKLIYTFAPQTRFNNTSKQYNYDNKNDYIWHTFEQGWASLYL